MINNKLLEKSKKLWVDIDIDAFIKKWIPSEVINDILEWSIDYKEWKNENFIDYDEYVKNKKTLSSNKMELCTN